MLDTHEYYGDQLDIPIRVIKLDEYDTEYDFGESHRHNYFELFFFKNGGGEHLIDFESYPIPDESVHIVASRNVHLLKRTKSSNGFIILFKREALISSKESKHKDYFFLLNQKLLLLNSMQYSKIQFFIEDLESELKQNTSTDSEIAKTSLHLIIQKLIKYSEESFNSSSNQTGSNLYQKFIYLLEDHFELEFTIGFYAEKLFCSNESLTKEIKKVSGKSVAEMISDRRLLESKRLVKHSDFSFKEISNLLNFNDSAHFNHFFKGKVGKTPSEFRSE